LPLTSLTSTEHGLRADPELARAVISALDHSDDMLLVADAAEDGLPILAANHETERVVGCAPGGLRERSLLSLLGPTADPAAVTALREASREGKPYRAELPCRSDAGATFWFGLALIPMREPGWRSRVLVLGRDITDRVRAREQEQAIQGLLAKVFVTVDVPVYILDPQDRILRTNPALDRLLGSKPGTLNGKPGIELFSPATRLPITTARAKQDEDGQDYTVMAELLMPDGSELRCRVSGAVVIRPGFPRFRVITVRPEAHQPRHSSGGRIQMVGLEQVRARLGPKWTELRDRVMATAEHVLRRALGPGETFLPTKDEGFLVCFANASEEEATFRAAALAQEIRRRLVGEEGMEEVTHVMASAAALPPGAETMPAAQLANLIKERVAQRLAAIQETTRQRLATALESASYRTETVRARGRGEPAGTLVSLPPELERAHDAAVSVLPPEETEALNLDVMLLGLAHEFALTSAAENNSTFIFVPLSVESWLVRKRLRACVEACTAFGERQRQRLVFVFASRNGGGYHQLYDALIRLRPFCRSVGVGLEGLDAGELDVSGQRITLVLLNAATLRGPEAVARAKPRINALHAARCRVMVRGATQAEAPGLFDATIDLVATQDA
jgi:PAS domain S-box-containing protein